MDDPSNQHLDLGGGDDFYSVGQFQEAQQLRTHVNNHQHGLVNDAFLSGNYYHSYHDDTCVDLAPGHTHSHDPTKSHQQPIIQAHHGRSMSMAAISTDRTSLSTPQTPQLMDFQPYFNPNSLTMNLLQQNNMFSDNSTDWVLGMPEEQHSSPAIPSNRSECDDACATECPESHCDQGADCQFTCNEENCSMSPCLSSCDDPDCEEAACSDQECFGLDEPGLQAASSLASLPSRPAPSSSQPPSQPFSSQGTVMPVYMPTQSLQSLQSLDVDSLGGLSASFSIPPTDYTIPTTSFPIQPVFASQGLPNGSQLGFTPDFISHAVACHHPGFEPTGRCMGPCADMINSWKFEKCPLPRNSHFHPGSVDLCANEEQECGALLDSSPGVFLDHLMQEHPLDYEHKHMTVPQQPVWPDSQDPRTIPAQATVGDHLHSRDSPVEMSSPTLSSPARTTMSSPTPITPDSDNGQSCTCKWEEGGLICGQRFASDDALQKHCKENHLSKMTKQASGFPCHWHTCSRDISFSQKSKLERHMQTHTGFKPVRCTMCNLALSAKQSLAQHMRIHTGEKPWVCNHPGCKQAFKQQSALTMHKRTHTGEKPLQCEVCGKRFGESSNLSKHRKTHNIIGQFTCGTCGKDFHRLDQMRRHMKVHEKVPGDGVRGRVVTGRVTKNTK